MLDGLRARLEKLLADHTPPGDPRARTTALHAALLETKVAVSAMRDALSATEQALLAERRQLEDSERRGQQAARIPDPETVAVAERFAERHRERTGVLERKVALQRDELALAERDLEQLTVAYREARQGTGPERTPAQEAAWRDLEAAGGTRPETDTTDELLKSQLHRADLDRTVDAQLEHLKQKLRKEP